MPNSTDRIEKTVTLKAPVARVWRALTDNKEFSSWFGMNLHEPFAEGKTIHGTFEGSFPQEAIDAELKKAGLPTTPIQMPAPNFVFCTVQKLEPERYFAFRWIPFGIEAGIDPKTEPMTLVEFVLEKRGDKETLLKITESGFDKVPAHRRARAFHMNDGGWAAQGENLKRYVESR